MSVFETETMAELCVKQGLVTEALAIYRGLVAEAPDEATRTRRAARLSELERIAGGVAAARAPAPRGATKGGTKGETTGETWLTVERRADALHFAWSLPADTASPALQILLLRRGETGIEAETRTVPLATPRGTTTVAAPNLYSVRAAVGRLDDTRFIPLARLPDGGS